MTSPASSAPAPSSSSCWTRTLDCLRSRKTVQLAKMGCCFLGGTASFIVIPVPFLNGFVANAFFFNMTHACAQHPDSVFMERATSRAVLTSRNWKDLTLGSSFSGIGGGFASLALAANNGPLTAISMVAGLIIGSNVAYTNTLFRDNYAPLPAEAPPAPPPLAPAPTQDNPATE